MISDDELVRRFTYHPPTADRAIRHETIRTLFLDFADTISHLIPDGREEALVYTKLEEALFWANAAVARNG